MKDAVIYRPYRSHSWLVPITTSLVGFAFIAAGWAFPRFDVAFFFLAMGIISIWLTKALYDSSDITICFENEGLRVFGGKHKSCQYLLWENFPYAYYARSFKGHLFVVLSPKKLDPKQVKYFANKGANSLRVLIDFVAVFHVDILQNASELKHIIYNRTKYTDAY